MANRYWVGGTANWDGTAGTKWALTSGGLGGQAVPTSADDVFFDGSSTGTCTIASGNTGAKSINCTGFTGTLAGTDAITVSGSITLVAGMTYTYIGSITINATATLITASQSLGTVIISGSGITVTLGDAINMSNFYDINLTQGTFDTANYSVTIGRFTSSNTNTRTVNLGSSTVTLSSSIASGAWNCATSTNLTVNAGTSTISLTGSPTKVFRGGGKTYYILTNATGSLTLTIRDDNTFHDITCSYIGNHTLAFFGGSTQTVTNFTYTPSANASVTFSPGTGSSTTASIVKSSGTVNVSRFIIKNMIGTGGATFNATDSVDLGNNTGWNITAAAARYWVGGTATWDSTAGSKWATGSGGLGGASVPAAVTPVYFDNNSGANTVTIGSTYGCAGLICTGFTGTLTGSNPLNLYGELTLVSGMTYSYTGSLTFYKTCTITSAGKTLGSVTTIVDGQTITLGDACTLGTTNTFSLSNSTLDLNGNTLSTGIFSSNVSTTRAITFGSANIALTSTTASTTVLDIASATGFTFTGTGAFTRNMAATATMVFGTTAGTTSNAPNLTVNAGSSALTITSGSYFKDVNFTGSTSTVTATYNAAGNLTLASGGTYTSVVPTFLASGTLTSVGKTLGNTTVNGSGITVTLGDAATLGTTNTLTLTSGTFDAANFNVTTGLFASSNSNTRTLTMGSGTWTISGSGASAWNTATTTNLTLNANTSTVALTSASAKTFAGGGKTYYNLNQGGAGALTISGSNTFNNITNTTQPATVTFTAGTTQTVSNFGLTGTAGNLITINSSSAGSQATLSKSSGTISVDYLSIRDSNATGGASWYAGANSTSVSNNTGWIFTAPPTAGGSFFMFLS